jgi:hypothetical protein
MKSHHFAKINTNLLLRANVGVWDDGRHQAAQETQKIRIKRQTARLSLCETGNRLGTDQRRQNCHTFVEAVRAAIGKKAGGSHDDDDDDDDDDDALT